MIRFGEFYIDIISVVLLARTVMHISLRDRISDSSETGLGVSVVAINCDDETRTQRLKSLGVSVILL